MQSGLGVKGVRGVSRGSGGGGGRGRGGRIRGASCLGWNRG